MTESRTRLRMKVLVGLVVFMFGAVTTRLWFLQVLAAPTFRAQADQNQLRLVPTQPIRGEVLDRNGHVLVGDRPSIAVTVDRQLIAGHEDAVLYRLSGLLHQSVRQLLAAVNSVQYLPYQPVPVAVDVSKQTIFYIREHQNLFPGVGYELVAVPAYPNGPLAAQVLGTLGQAAPGQWAGQSGVESVYNKWLVGKPGTRAIQVDAAGNVLNSNFRSIPSTPGDNLVLSIDTSLQRLVEQSLVQGMTVARQSVDPLTGRPYPATGGAVIVMNPNNGQVLAMASYPSYDPSVFLKGLTTSQFRQDFLSPQSHEPLVNRAIQSAYPPGSTFKGLVASAALNSGVVSESSILDCPGTWTVPGTTQTLHNWNPANTGLIGLPTALAQSCDTFFYQLGYAFWQRLVHSGYNVNTGRGGVQLFQRELSSMGVGRPTGIDLPGEASGVLPTMAFKKQLFQSDPAVYGKYWEWEPGDDVEMSIGQGFVEVTPIQLADFYSALANGGAIYQPHVGMKVVTPDGKVVHVVSPKVTGHLPITPQEAAYLRSALQGVVEPGGTAATAFAGFPLSQIPVAAKTGTADINGIIEPDSWFVAMAPANHPKYVVVSIVEQAGEGGVTSAPIVRRILEGLFGLTKTKIQLGHDLST